MASRPQHYDLLVVGGGPAGVTAALRGRELGASVALLDRAGLGGTCTNDGCVPTRVLAHAALQKIPRTQVIVDVDALWLM